MDSKQNRKLLSISVMIKFPLTIPRNRFLSLLISCMVMMAAGTISCYSLFSEALRTKFQMSLSEVNIISSMGNTALVLYNLIF